MVDDNAEIRALSVRALSEANFLVIQAGDGVEALEKLEVHAVAVALVDLKMPRLDGLELGRRLADARPRLQVLYMTAYPEMAASIPPGQVLVKPFNFDDMVALVRTLGRKYWMTLARGSGEFPAKGPR